MAFSTTPELVTYIERELGHQLSGASSQRNDILSHLDRAHKIVCAGGGFLNYSEDGRRMRDDAQFSFAGAQNPLVLTLNPALTTGSVAATRNSTSITFDADPNSGTTVAGMFLRVQGEDELYRVSTHTAAATAATLDGPYCGPANVTAATFELYQLHYTLGSSNILRLVSPIRAFGDYSVIPLVDKEELVSKCPLQDVEQEFPLYAALLTESAGTLILQFSSTPLDYERVEIDYIPIPTTLALSPEVNPLLPSQYRLTLAHLAIYHMSLRNDDNRAAQHLTLARSMFRELLDWDEKLTASTDPDRGRVMITCGSSSGKIDVQKEYE